MVQNYTQFIVALIVIKNKSDISFLPFPMEMEEIYEAIIDRLNFNNCKANENVNYKTIVEMIRYGTGNW
jgi:hypothetical protein